MGVKERAYEFMDCVDLVQDMHRWRALVNEHSNYMKCGEFLLAEEIFSFSVSTLHHGVS
jgi:hypothetical protein